MSTDVRIADVVVRHAPRHTDESGMSQAVASAGEPPLDAGLARLSWSRRAAGTVTAWQLHPDRWDWWMVLHGDAKIVLHDLREGSSTREVTWEIFAGDDAEPCVVGVPPGVAHGYKVLRGPLELLSMLTVGEQPGAAEPEELHLPHDDPAIGYDWSSSALIRG